MPPEKDLIALRLKKREQLLAPGDPYPATLQRPPPPGNRLVPAE